MTSLNSTSAARRALIALLLVLAVAVAACSPSELSETTTTAGPDAETTTTTVDTSNDDLVFGNGSLPDTVPAGFPIPDEGTVGATMIDRVNGVTEFVIIFPAAFEDVVDYFETNLPATGFAIDNADGTEGRWVIAFSGDATGEVFLETAGSGLTQGLVRFSDQLEG